MQVAEENGLVFNSKKCLIKQKQIKFFGTIYADNGIHPDPKKIEDLKNMPTPQNKKELQEFLGFITYMAPFIPNLCSQSACLRDLLKNAVSFIWEPHHKLCFETLKNCVTTDSTLQYYDTSVTPVLQVDASLRGLGASLLPNHYRTLKLDMHALNVNYWQLCPQFSAFSFKEFAKQWCFDHCTSSPVKWFC